MGGYDRTEEEAEKKRKQREENDLSAVSEAPSGKSLVRDGPMETPATRTRENNQC